MKSIMKALFYDKELVNNMKKTKADQAQLVNGKITLAEYLHTIQP